MKRVAIEIQSGCIFISGAVDFDDRPGAVRDALAESVQIWLAAMNRAIVSARDCGHLKFRYQRTPDGFRNPWPDPGLALRGPFPAEARLHRARQPRLPILARYGVPSIS